MAEKAPEETTSELPLVNRAMILLGKLRGAIEGSKKERMSELRRQLSVLLTDANDDELHEIAAAHLQARDESVEEGLQRALGKLRTIRDEGRKLLVRDEPGEEP